MKRLFALGFAVAVSGLTSPVKAEAKAVSNPIQKPDAKWTNDECYLSFIQSDELSNADRITVDLPRKYSRGRLRRS